MPCRLRHAQYALRDDPYMASCFGTCSWQPPPSGSERIPLRTWAFAPTIDDGSRRVPASMSSLTARRHVWCHIRHRRDAEPLVALRGGARATSDEVVTPCR